MTNLITFTKPSHSYKEFIISLKAQKKAYRLKIVEDTLDENDPCPTYQMRVALKPFTQIMNENLRCNGKSMPPSLFKVDKDNYDADGEYSVSSEFIEKYTLNQPQMKDENGKNAKSISYDIEI